MSRLLEPNPTPGTATTIETRWATVDGHRMRYLQCGQGQPVLLIHGLMAYAFSWRFTMPALAQQATVYAPDALGCGLSERPQMCDRSFRGNAARMLRFLDAVGVEKADIVGTSHGGAVAMMLAEMAPQRVRKLVLVDPANPWSRHGRLMTKMFATPVGARLFRAGAPLLAKFNGYFIGRMFGDRKRIPPDTIAGYSAPLRTPGTIDNALGIVKNWHRDMRLLKEALPRIADIPTLIVWGTRDKIVFPDSAEALRNHFHNVKLVWIEGAGHLPYEEKPEEFNRVLSEFLAE